MAVVGIVAAAAAEARLRFDLHERSYFERYFVGDGCCCCCCGC